MTNEKKLNNKISYALLVLGLTCLSLACNVRRKMTAASDQSIVFMGDSITRGWQTLMPDFFSKGNYVNKGIPGQTTHQMMARFDQDVIRLHPHALVLLGGTNDVAGLGGEMPVDSIFKNITTMAFQARKEGIKVILCSVIPAYEYACCKTVKPVPLIAALNYKLQRFAKKERFGYLDYFSVLADKRRGLRAELTNDGVHPNKAGYELMKPLALKAIADSYK